MYQITDRQRAFLDGFTCQRLNADDRNDTLIRSFVSEKGTALVDSLRGRGGPCDHKGTIAYYVVKNAAGEIVLFFSLRCGLICEPGYICRIAGLLDESRTLREAIRGKAEGDPYWTEYLQLQEQVLGKEELDRRIANLKHHIGTKINILNKAEQDRATLPDQDVIRVDETHAAVELVEFCVNDAARSCWDKAQMGGRRLGTTMFWAFIVPKMLAVSEVAGCEYAYLFAAGKRGDKLVRYYRDELHFIEPKKLSTVKPNYDSQCVLMIKKLFTGKPGEPGEMGVLEPDLDYMGLDAHRRMFFLTFNEPQVS